MECNGLRSSPSWAVEISQQDATVVEAKAYERFKNQQHAAHEPSILNGVWV